MSSNRVSSVFTGLKDTGEKYLWMGLYDIGIGGFTGVVVGTAVTAVSSSLGFEATTPRLICISAAASFVADTKLVEKISVASFLGAVGTVYSISKETHDNLKGNTDAPLTIFMFIGGFLGITAGAIVGGFEIVENVIGEAQDWYYGDNQ